MKYHILVGLEKGGMLVCAGQRQEHPDIQKRCCDSWNGDVTQWVSPERSCVRWPWLLLLCISHSSCFQQSTLLFHGRFFCLTNKTPWRVICPPNWQNIGSKSILSLSLNFHMQGGSPSPCNSSLYSSIISLANRLYVFDSFLSWIKPGNEDEWSAEYLTDSFELAL